MAHSLEWKIYVSGVHVGSCKFPHDAAAFAALRGEGTDVRWGNEWVVWREGRERFSAAASYEDAATIMRERVRDRQREHYDRAYGGKKAQGS